MLEKEKSRRIVDELLTYFLSHDIDQVSIELGISEEGFLATIEGHCEKLPDDIYQFAENLNIPRNLDLESYYNELLGGHQSLHEDKDYQLLGMMIDNADIMYENKTLMVEVFRHRY